MNNKRGYEYNIKYLEEYFIIIKKRKFWFLGAFIIFLILSIFIFYYINKDSQYSAKSQISISEFNKFYQETITEYYPEDASKLWLISTDDRVIQKYFEEIIFNIRSDDFLSSVSTVSNNLYTAKDLKGRIKAETVIDENKLIVTTYFSNPKDAMFINKTLIKEYDRQKQAEFRNYYEILISKLNSRLTELDKQYDEISIEAEQYIIEINKKLVDSIDKNINDSVELKGVNYLSPAIASKIAEIEKEKTLLAKILDNMKKNEEIFVRRMTIYELSDVDKNINIFSMIIISIAVAIFASFIFGNLINKIIEFRLKK